ncbi:hypothetical protein GRF59_06655 [Paenibacillus sp. HJL G12]|uniref:Uncharacterized protein n=1 Tax=Paenibacillus dendrobii TaxID=2691084 RepID=A0A7X3LHJ9_9BACL|nr:hypothetical protein [Paenibacillus dendrobii]MWV43309.1 hypothetical protein [Paenibacillus dendrobii]
MIQFNICFVKQGERILATNIPKSIEKMLSDEECYEYCCVYQNGELIQHDFMPTEPDIENILDPSPLEERVFKKSKIKELSL